MLLVTVEGKLAQLELKLANTAGNNRKSFLKYLNSKKQPRNNTGPFFDEYGHLTETCTKQRCLMLSSLQFSIPAIDSEGPNALSWSTVTVRIIHSQPTPNLHRICCSCWLSLSLWGLMKFIQKYSKTWLMPRPLSMISGGYLERSQSTGN